MENKIFEGFEAGEYDVPMENNVRNGKGTQKFKKGEEEYTLECTWANGKKNGEGILLDKDYVISMKLNFVDDLVEGEGVLYQNGQVTFKGVWKAGMRNGFCQEFDGGRLIFKGEYADDMRNGYGILYDASQEIVFEGQWVNNEQGLISISENDNGDREMTEKNENGTIKYIGGFKEGTVLRDGKGVEYDEEGKPVREIVFKEGLEERRIKEFKGENIVIYDSAGKKVYEGQYIKDNSHRYPPHGKGRLFEGTVMVYNGDFVKGKREGHGCSYHPTRCLKYEGDWMNDLPHGVGKYYDSEGTLVTSGEFCDGLYEDEKIRIDAAAGKVEDVTKGGCACFGKSRRAQTKQLTSLVEDDSSNSPSVPAIKSLKELNALPETTAIIRIDSNCMNEEEASTIDFYRFSKLRRLIIGDNSLQCLKQLNLREMKSLKYVEIGNNSCSLPDMMNKKYTVVANKHSLCIESCPLLEEVVIGSGSCLDFIRCIFCGMVFFLLSFTIDLPALQKIIIGSEDNTPSNNFYFCETLQLRGNSFFLI